MTFFLILVFVIILVITVTSIRVFYGFKPPLNIESGSPTDFGFPDYRTVWIPTKKNKKLFGWYIPVSPSERVTEEQYDAPTLILVHGWGGNAEFALPLALPFKGKNVNLLLFDHRNHGNSDKNVFSSLGTMAEDVDAAIDWVQSNQKGSGKIALIGHSIGAAAVLYAASRRNDIGAVVSLSTFAHIKKIVAGFLRRFGVMQSHVPTIIRLLEWLVGHSLDEAAPVQTITKLPCPALLLHGTADETISFRDFEEICKIAIEQNVPDIRCLTLEGGVHFPIDEVTARSGEIMRFLQEHDILPR